MQIPPRGPGWRRSAAVQMLSAAAESLGNMARRDAFSHRTSGGFGKLSAQISGGPVRLITHCPRPCFREAQTQDGSAEAATIAARRLSPHERKPATYGAQADRIRGSTGSQSQKRTRTQKLACATSRMGKAI